MKSTYETLNAQSTDTSVPHYSKDNVEHNLPAGMFPDGETYVDASRLEQWARETGNMHSMLQLGVQQGLIKVRAAFKSVKKDDVWTPEYGQANVDAWKWPVQNKPSQGGSKAVAQARYNDCMAAVANSAQAKLTRKQISAILLAVYGEETLTACLDAIGVK